MSKGCARSSKKGCGGLAAGRAVRIDEHSVARFVASPDRQVSSQPKVTSETITSDSRKESRRLNPLPERYILLVDDFGRGSFSADVP
jgi:hypothetical protein